MCILLVCTLNEFNLIRVSHPLIFWNYRNAIVKLNTTIIYIPRGIEELGYVVCFLIQLVSNSTISKID